MRRSTCGLKMRKKPRATSSSCVAKSIDREEDVQPGRLLDPDDVDADEQPGERDPDDDVPRVRPQRLPEDREVVRDEDHRDRDGDHVVEHLRPRRPEGDELVEGVPREARRAARLRVVDGPLRVGRRGGGEDHAADDEDDRRQAERDPRGQPERVVDRRADVAVRGREERRSAEHAFEAVALPTPPGHGPMLLGWSVPERRPAGTNGTSWYGTLERITCGSKRSSRLT